MEKMAVVAPMPRASIRIAVIVNPVIYAVGGTCSECLAGLRQPLIAALVAVHLLGLLDAPVGEPGGPSRFLWIQPLAKIVVLQ